MANHGWGKLQMLLEGGQFPDPIGIGGGISLVLVVLAEFVCAILVILGLATRLAAVPTVIAMAVAAFVVHGNDPWSMEKAAKAFFAGESKSWASKEPALLFLFPFLALVLTGAGRFSIDHLVWSRWRRPRA